VAGVLAATVAATLALTSCGGGNEPTTPTSTAPGSETAAPAAEPVTLRFIWWGNDTRNELTQQVIDLYTSKNPHVTIETETSDFAGYWQKLSTQIAGGAAPDIIQMDEKDLAEYASQGALLDLESVTIDTADWAEGTIDPGRFEGTLYATTWAVNSPVFLANKSLFDKAGIAMPDDTTWTWDQFADLAVQLQTAGGNGAEFFGTENLIGIDGATKIWIRQQGDQQFTDDGIGFDAETVQPWFTYWKDLMDAGGTAPATATIENQTTPVDQALLGTNRVAIGFQWSNQVNAVGNASGEEIVLLRPPTQTGKATDAQLWYKSSMYLSASSKTEHPEEVAAFINFLMNDEEAGAILGTERGVPTNLKVREAIAGDLSEGNVKVVDFMEAISTELGTGGAVPLPGGGQSETIQRRATDAVLRGNLDPAAAATQFVTELKTELKLS
jgi:multiple sugar transport system substrate-binding protein